MAGTFLEIVGRTRYDFSKLSNGTQTIVLARAVPCEQWRQATLFKRFHQHESYPWVAGQAIDVLFRAEGHSDEDPNTDFVYRTGGDGGELAKVTISASLSSTAPSLLAAPAYFPGTSTLGQFGGFGRVELRATQPAGTNNLIVILSVGISFKS